jgi:hypothetical protein
MERRIILLIIALVAVVGVILLLKVDSEGAVTYQQNIHRNDAVYMTYYNACARGPCGNQAIPLALVQVGEVTFPKNVLCQCPDGSTYQIDYGQPY